MKLTLTKVIKREKKGKNGPFTSLNVQTQEYGSQWLSGFGNGWNANWKSGMTVDVDVIEVEKDGRKFLNFKKPEEKNLGNNDEIMAALKRIEDGIQNLADYFIAKENGNAV